jgi:CRP-like cAMP-binding protein
MALDHDIRALEAVPIVGRLDAEARRLIAFSSDRFEFARGDTVVELGQPLSGAIAVLAGSLIYDTGGPGRADRRVMEAGELFGDAALLVDVVSPAQLMAREASAIMVVPRQIFRRVMAEFPDAAAIVSAELTIRLNALRTGLNEIGAALAAIDRYDVPSSAAPGGDPIGPSTMAQAAPGRR